MSFVYDSKLVKIEAHESVVRGDDALLPSTLMIVQKHQDDSLVAVVLQNRERFVQKA